MSRIETLSIEILCFIEEVIQLNILFDIEVSGMNAFLHLVVKSETNPHLYFVGVLELRRTLVGDVNTT